MAAARVPVLWITGPPGAGKTTAGWAVYSALIRAGTAAAYADIDQLGMCYPEPASDPGRHRLKAANLDAVVTGYAAAGARCVVVAGVTDPVRGVDAALLPHAALTVCHLLAAGRERGRRLAARDGRLAGPAAAADAGGLPAENGWQLDTTARTPAQVAARILARWDGRRAAPGLQPARGPLSQPAPSAAGGEVLLICGPTGVGKSAVGFEVYQRELRAGRGAAFVDLDQIGVCSPGPARAAGVHRLRARNLAALWGAFRAAGATVLVAVGPVESAVAARVYQDALPGGRVTVARLHAAPAELTRRILLRGAGHGWAQPGDPLAGRPAARLRTIAAHAAAAADRLEAAGAGPVGSGTARIGTVRIDTSGLTIEAVAAALRTAALADRAGACSGPGVTR
jgi:adenylylsulfate kinase-like enzyme